MTAVTALRAAEGKLITAIDSATAAVESVGTRDLQDAVARFEEAVTMARARVAAAACFFGDCLAEAAGDVLMMATAIAEDAAPQVCSEHTAPAPEARPEPQVSACPGAETPVEEAGNLRQPRGGEISQPADVIDLGHAPEPPAFTAAANPPVPPADAPTPRPRRRARR
jgi:hypothetical protein